MVKVRNFDNTIITLSPQSLVDGSFQNWLGMEEKEGRRQVRKIYFDFRSLKTEHPEKSDNPDSPGNPEKPAAPNPLLPTTNITRFRHDIEQWLQQNPKVATDKTILVKHSDTLQASGCCVEIVFWLKAKDAITYEHDTSDIMEYIYAKAADYGLSIYQPNIEK
jgi:miniconductance mechanosensitive channel